VHRGPRALRGHRHARRGPVGRRRVGCRYGLPGFPGRGKALKNGRIAGNPLNFRVVPGRLSTPCRFARPRGGT
jgi:hypothetical protein